MENEINCHQKILSLCISDTRRRWGIEVNLMICEITMMVILFIFKPVSPETPRPHIVIKTMFVAV